MKVVLLQDVAKVGDAGTIQSVKDGFARNYLIPQGLATEATPGRIKEAEQRMRSVQRKIEREEEAQRSLSEKIDGQRIQIVARVGEQGRLYGSITASDIAEKLSSQIGDEIDRRKVLLGEPIRTIGEHAVVVHLVGKLRPEVTVVVTPEEGMLEAANGTESTPTDEDVESSEEQDSEAENKDEAAVADTE